MRLGCDHLSVVFEAGQRRIQALSDVTFQSREGEFLSIVGPSGCGKTTLLRTLARLLPAQQGSLERIPAAGDKSSNVLLVSQEHNVFPWMTVLDNATFGLAMQGVGKSEREARARELLQDFGLVECEQAYPHQLSAGMKQRVAVIRAFISEPAVLLMDEPFSALDVPTRLTLQQELLDLWEREHKSVVFVTHDIDEAILLSDRILVLSSRPGTIVAELAVEFARPRSTMLLLEDQFLSFKKRVLSCLTE